MDDAGTLVTDKVHIRETWEAMESLVDDGIAKSIGISNASAQLLYDMQTYARHPIPGLQIEHYPYLVQPELV
jgi:D-xylose reductase